MERFLSNPRVLVLIIAIIVVSGLGAFSASPRTEDPRTGNRVASVLTTFPGASASRIEVLLTEPLENKLREIPEIDHIDSSSSAGLSALTISLKDEVHADNTDRAWSEVRDKLEEAGKLLPAAASEPLLDDQRSSSYTMIVALTWDESYGEETDILLLGRYAKELESQLRGMEGTDFLRLHGDPAEEVVVSVDSARAALLGLSIEEISTAVRAADAKVSAGEIRNQHQRLALEVEGAFNSMERIRQVPLQLADSGAAVRVGDLAQVRRQPRTPMSKLAIVNGQPAVVVAIRMSPDQRGDRWSAKVRETLDRSAELLPANINIEVLFDQQQYTSSRLGTLVQNIIVGFILIALVLWVTLGWRSALIVAMALPLTVLFALACMYYTGLPIHQMSVTGLIVALGIMVDNAIVMVDTVARYKREGQSGLRATFSAVSHLWMPLLGSTLTTILAFMPIVVMPGSAGEFVGGISLTVIFSLVGSYLISHLVVAGMAGRFLKREQQTGWSGSGIRWPTAAREFQRSVNWAIVNPRRVLLMVMVLPLLGFWGGSRLPQQFFPPSDRNMINFEVYLPSSVSLNATRELTERISADVADIEGIESLHWFVGGNAPSFYYNLMQHRDGAQYYAQAMLTADHFSTANRLVPELQRRFDDRFPEAQIIVRRLEQGPAFNAPVELRLIGPSLDTLKAQGEELRRRMLAIEDVVHVRATLSEAIPKLWLDVDESRARLSQLSLADTASQLRVGVNGALSGSVLEETQSLSVRVEAAGYRSGDINEINSWVLSPGTAGDESAGVPLASLGSVRIKPAQGVIPRRDGERINTIEIYIRDGVLPDQVLNRIHSDFAETALDLPSGYRLDVGGEDEKRDTAVSKLMASVGPILMLLIISVVMAFNSFRLSTIIFAVALQAAGLGLLVLSLSGLPFGFTSIIGLMGLIGLAINAAIVILAELKTDSGAVRGEVSAVVTGVSDCSRHIFSTTITTVMGFIPLMLGGGGFWPPFAMVIAGGTVLTTILSFYFVPVMFTLMAKRRAFDLNDEVALSQSTEVRTGADSLEQG